MERKSLSERKSLVSEYNDLIESMKTEKKEEVEILKNQQEDLRKNLEQKNEDLVAALDESRELVREKDLEIDDLNEEIFKVALIFRVALELLFSLVPITEKRIFLSEPKTKSNNIHQTFVRNYMII